MATESAGLIEVEGDNWAFGLDLRGLPRYWVLVLKGKTSQARNDQLRKVVHQHIASLTDDVGLFYPVIIDASEEGTPSMEGLQGGVSLVAEFGPRMHHIFFVLDPATRQGRLLQNFLSMLERVAGRQFEVVASAEEAIAQLTTPPAAPDDL